MQGINANALMVLAFLFVQHALTVIATDLPASSYYKIGFVLKPHGLKGEVTVALDPEIPNDLSTVHNLFLEKDNRLVPYFIESLSMKGSKAFVKFEDVNTAEEAVLISKRTLYLPKSERPKSARGEFYDDEVIAFEVTDENLGVLGTIRHVSNAGPNRLLVLDHQGKEILIPVNSPFIKSINKSKKAITVNLPDGFLDI